MSPPPIPPKGDKPVKTWTPEEADREVERFFRELEEELQGVPQDVVQLGAQRMVDFLKGDVGWGEILNLSPDTMQRIAEFGHMQLQAGRLEDAERFFKVLTMLNWNNADFHTMLGVVYQRQKRPGEAIAQFTEAVTLNPEDGVALVNRAALYLKHGWTLQAKADLGAALALADDERAAWRKQARALQQRLAQMEARKPGGRKGTKDHGR